MLMLTVDIVLDPTRCRAVAWEHSSLLYYLPLRCFFAHTDPSAPSFRWGPPPFINLHVHASLTGVSLINIILVSTCRRAVARNHRPSSFSFASPDALVAVIINAAAPSLLSMHESVIPSANRAQLSLGATGSSSPFNIVPGAQQALTLSSSLWVHPNVDSGGASSFRKGGFHFK